MYTSTTRVTGFASGLDSDSYVKQLMAAASTKYYSQQRKVQKLQWKQEAYRTAAKSMTDFQDKWLSLTSSTALRLSSTYANKFKANVTNSKGETTTGNIEVTRFSGAGSHKIEVESVAEKAEMKSEYAVSAKLSTEDPTKNSFSFTYKDKTVDVSISKADLEKKVEDDIVVEKTESMTDEEYDAARSAAIEAAIKDPEVILSVIKDKISTGLGDSYYEDLDFSVDSSGNMTIKSNVAGRDMELAATSGSALHVTKEKSGKIETSKTMGEILGSSFFNSGAVEVSMIGTADDGSSKSTPITVSSDTTVKEFMEKVNASGIGVKMTYNSVAGTYSLTSESTGSDQKISIGSDTNSKSVFAALGFNSSYIANGVAGKDAIVKVDGVKAESSTNKLSFSEFTADISNAKVGEEYTVSTKQDTDALYSMISDFVKDYNELISGINGTVTEKVSEGPKGKYEPLTDDEKSSMEQEDIEKWEKEAKKGILYNDTVLKNFLSGSRQSFYTASVDDPSGALLSDGSHAQVGIYNYGITTSNDRTKPGQIVIDETKLKAALEENPDTIINLMKGVAGNLNDNIKYYTGNNGPIAQRAGIAGTSTEYTNSLYTQIKATKTAMSTELERLKEKESAYYKMFSDMESAIAQNNSNLDMLYSL